MFNAANEDGSPGIEKPELVERYVGLVTGAHKELVDARLRQVREEYQRFPGDTGSTEVQVALLTNKISALSEHLVTHRKDHSSRRGLQAMLNRRRSLLQYLRRKDFDKYAVIISKLGLRDNYAPQDRFSVRYKAALRSPSHSNE